MSDWEKIAGAPYYLEIRAGRLRTSYRVNYRAHGLNLRAVLKGEFKNWKHAQRSADELIATARFGEAPEKKALKRCEDLAEQLIAESAGQDKATQEGKINIFRNHLVPWLNEHYPHASDLTIETWPKYKLYKRGLNPTIALENHVKYFRMLARRAFDLGLVKPKIRIAFNLKKEEFRSRGFVIPADDMKRILDAANYRKSRNKDGSASHGQGFRVWYIRILTQRMTGMRPGEVRNLRKKAVTLPNGTVLPPNIEFKPTAGGFVVLVRLFEQDTKTHRYREFLIKNLDVIEALLDQSKRNEESPYFFPMETDPSRPTDKHLGGWNAILKRAGVNPEYTPHDLRHSFASEMFQKTKNFAALCYALDMSLETAQEVYIHLNANDTDEIANLMSGVPT